MELERQTKAMAKALKVGGLMNVQYAIKDGTIYVLEVNPRASRTVPFVAKTIGAPIAKIAARIMAGEKLDDAIAAYGKKPDPRNLNHIAVKEAVFPFARFPRRRYPARPGNALDRRSHRPRHRFPRWPLPRPSSAPASIYHAKARCSSRCATRTRNGSYPPSASSPRSASRSWQPAAPPVSLAKTVSRPSRSTRSRKAVRISRTRSATARSHLVINTTDSNKAISDSKSLRRATLMQKVPYYTTMAGAEAAARAIKALKAGSLEVRTLQSYF